MGKMSCVERRNNALKKKDRKSRSANRLRRNSRSSNKRRRRICINNCSEGLRQRLKRKSPRKVPKSVRMMPDCTKRYKKRLSKEELQKQKESLIDKQL